MKKWNVQAGNLKINLDISRLVLVPPLAIRNRRSIIMIVDGEHDVGPMLNISLNGT